MISDVDDDGSGTIGYEEFLPLGAGRNTSLPAIPRLLE